MSSDNGQADETTDDETAISRRDILSASVMIGLTATPGLLDFRDDNHIGVLDTHNVQNSGEFVAQDPTPLNFGRGIQAQETSQGGVNVTAPDSSLNQWSEDDSGTLSGPSAKTGIPNRKLVSEQDRTITVGEDVETVQEAMNEIPVLLQHQYDIDIPAGDYSNEDVTVPSYITQEHHADADAGGGVWVTGDATTPTNVTIGSLYIVHASGKRPFILEGVEITSGHPEADRSASFQYAGPSAMIIRDCTFSDADGTRAIMCYGGKVTTKGTVDLGVDNYSFGIMVKNYGCFHDSCNANGGDLTGNCTNRAYSANGHGTVIIDKQASLSGTDNKIICGRGVAHEYDSSAPASRNQKEYGNVSGTGSSLVRDTDYFLTAGSWVQVPWESIEFDDNGEADLSNDQIVIDFDGKVKIDAQITLNELQDDERLFIKVEKNGAGVADGRATGDPTYANPATVNKTIPVTTGDTLTFHAHLAAGADRAINSTHRSSYWQVSHR